MSNVGYGTGKVQLYCARQSVAVFKRLATQNALPTVASHRCLVLYHFQRFFFIIITVCIHQRVVIIDAIFQKLGTPVSTQSKTLSDITWSESPKQNIHTHIFISQESICIYLHHMQFQFPNDIFISFLFRRTTRQSSFLRISEIKEKSAQNTMFPHQGLQLSLHVPYLFYQK